MMMPPGGQIDMKADSPLVTYYHSVAPTLFEGWPLRFLTMKLDRFEREMEHIARRKWRTVFMDEWWSMREGKVPMQGNELAITFDDGLLDNWVYAYPIIRKHGLKMTLFVCPELIEDTDRVRPNLEDVQNGRCGSADLVGLGHLSWGELRAMQDSGHVDVQSHTMSHTKHIISDELRGVHYGGFEGYYPALNTVPIAEKARYMADPGFSLRIPIGTPLFAETSAVIARIKRISADLMVDAAALAKEHDLARPEERAAYESRLRELHGRYKGRKALVESEESEAAHAARVEYEVVHSKRIIEEKLGKPVRFVCWPHGGNSDRTHAVAKSAGYVASTVGRMHARRWDHDRIPRTGTDWQVSPAMGRWMFDYKMGANFGRQPYRSLWAMNELKNRILGKH